MTKTEVIIVAAGKGLRLKSKTPKAFLNLKGKPLLYYSLKTFQKHPQIAKITLVVEKKHFFKTLNLARRYKFCKVDKIVPGGKERKDSVASGLNAIDTNADYVLIHDAARPFVTKKLITDILKALNKYEFVIPGIPAQDTLKYVGKKGIVRKTLNRGIIYQIQTPQGLRRNLVKRILRNTKNCKIAYDDASLVEKSSKVKIVSSTSSNIKITTPADLHLARSYLSPTS